MDVIFILGRCRARFEELNAARMSAAREGLTERHFKNLSARKILYQIWPVCYNIEKTMCFVNKLVHSY